MRKVGSVKEMKKGQFFRLNLEGEEVTMNFIPLVFVAEKYPGNTKEGVYFERVVDQSPTLLSKEQVCDLVRISRDEVKRYVSYHKTKLLDAICKAEDPQEGHNFYVELKLLKKGEKEFLS